MPVGTKGDPRHQAGVVLVESFESCNQTLGLMLFSLRAMRPDVIWKHRPIWLAFWAINIGLMLEIVLSLFPVGLLQTYQSVSVGYWSARSPEFLQTDLLRTLRWMRMIGDTVFAVGALAF